MSTFKLTVLALLVSVLFNCVAAARAAANAPYGADGLQHAGAVHFYAQPGTLDITLWKRDAAGNTADRTLTAILTGPDGTIHDRLKLITPPDKPEQRLEGKLQARVIRPGIYTLLLSANQDQYLRAQTWGFSTNAAQYMINAGTGHTDRAREETITLNGKNEPFGVFFKPVQRTFKIQLARLPATAKSVELRDATGEIVHTLNVTDGKAQATVEAGQGRREGIWELRLPAQRGDILIEGLNYGWTKNEKPLPVWTTNRSNFFELGNYHWLLQPRRFARNVKAGDAGTVEMTVFNNTALSMPLELSLDTPNSLGEIHLEPTRLEIAPGASRKVQIRYQFPTTLPDGRHDVYLVARDSHTNRQAFSLIQFRGGEAATDTVQLPLELKLYEHDQFQFAYEPDYPRANQFYFDADNRPWQMTRDGLQVLSNDEWQTITLPGDDQPTTYPVSALGTDNAGFVYGIVNRNGQPYVLRTESRTRRAELVELPPGGYYMPETFSGGRASAYPPVILRYVVDPTKAQVAFWSKVHRLELYLTEIKDGKLSLSAPILVSANCVGMSAHSGITSPVAADGDKLHLIWGETSDPAKNDPGVPTYTATYDRKTATLSPPTFLAWSPPVNDVHNMSTLIVDSQGNRHAIIGSHGKPFQYLHSPKGSVQWSTPKEITQMNPTYIGAVFDKADNIHLFFRQWRREIEFTGAELGYQQMEKDGVWKEQKPFAISALPGYSVFYHRLTVDRAGRLYLSFDYWSTWSPYRESYPNTASRRLLFTSNDNGKSWHSVTKQLLEEGISRTSR